MRLFTLPDHEFAGAERTNLLHPPFDMLISAGYLWYRGTRMANVDYTAAVGWSPPGTTSISMAGLGHAADTRYYYVLRPFLDGVETPDFDAVLQFVTDGGADWIGNVPAPVVNATAVAISAADIRLDWIYPDAGPRAPAQFKIWADTTHRPDRAGAADATIVYAGLNRYTETLTLTHGNRYWFSIVGVNGAAESAVITIGPVVADDTAPLSPEVIQDTTF